MVARSLVFKIGLCVTLVFFAAVPATHMIGTAIKHQGRQESFRTFITPQLQFIGSEVEGLLQGGQPLPEQLDELSRATRHRLRLVPWSDTSEYPSQLRTQSVIIDFRPPDQGLRHWVRVDLHGQPHGALEIIPAWGEHRRFPPPGPMRRPSGPRLGLRAPLIPEFTLIWLVLLGVAIVPPLWFWVIKPLKSMVIVARRLGSGDLETAVPVKRRDEFGELERAFESMRLELRRALSQRERLLTDVSHEMRGPLTRMMLAIPLLRQEGASGPMVDLLEREIAAANDLLGDVLTLARGRSPAAVTLAPVDLCEIARQTIDARSILADQHGIRLEVDLQLAPVMGDEHLLGRAMGNLLDNALKYTRPGGTVVVTTRAAEGTSRFLVEDNGPGIAEKHLPMIFEPFYRPDDSRSRETGGTGLGLSIVRGIAENLGGTVHLDSVLGQGTRVAIAFPSST